MQLRFIFLLSILLLPGLLSSQNPLGTKADSLRGGVRNERTCYDIHHYNLSLAIDTVTKNIQGSNEISFSAVSDFSVLQIDLFENMKVDEITSSGKKLTYRRESDAVFVTMPETIKKGQQASFLIHYSGQPVIAKNAPWDGGFTWTHDEKGNAWIAVSCQGKGASLWWPCKEDLSDEPDSMDIHCTVPQNLRCISNGRENPEVKNNDGTITYNWHISYPVNNYNVSVNIGVYSHWSDVYQSPDGSLLDLDYYVLKYNEPKAREQFTQVKPMLACYEEYLGKYPFWKDGYALVETPYLGMEHQGAIAYGNKFRQQYLGHDRSGQKLKFDYIIIHETGHEWWGNSVSSKDIADMWIHESFCTYTEAIYVECVHNYDTAMTYVNALKKDVRNRSPMIGIYGINREGDGDMYVKGMLFLNTLRHVVNDDARWWGMIKNMSDTTFKITNTEYKEVVSFFNKKTGMDLSPVFDQYVRHSSIPEFEYTLKKRRGGYELKYRWNADVKTFDMPLDVFVGGQKKRLRPTVLWQCEKLNIKSPEEFKVDELRYYVKVKKQGETKS